MYFTRGTSILQLLQACYNSHMCSSHIHSMGLQNPQSLYNTYIYMYLTCFLQNPQSFYNTYIYLTCFLQNPHSFTILLQNVHSITTPTCTLKNFTLFSQVYKNSFPPPTLSHVAVHYTTTYTYPAQLSPPSAGQVYMNLIFMWCNQLFFYHYKWYPRQPLLR